MELNTPAATVSNVAENTGGLEAGHLMETAIDEELFKFNSDDTPLMSLMLKARRVKVNSPEVDHYIIESQEATFTTSAAHTDSTLTQAILPMEAADRYLARRYTTLLARGIAGYDNANNPTPGAWLMLFVIGHDTNTGNPIVRAVNGPLAQGSDELRKVPAIPKGTVMVVLANSLYETQKEVDPDIMVPRPTRIYLQKRGMNQVVSDYFESQRKRIPFSKAVLAEQAIANFKVRGNRTLWAGRASKFKVDVPMMGMQLVYTTEGLRWQFRRSVTAPGKWTIEKIIALAKMFFTGEDCPKTALLLAGKDLLESLQCIKYIDHPEIRITTKTNRLGWSVTNFHTVFGDIEIKREPTLDRLGWSHSGALIGENRLVHYVYSAEHSFSDRVDGEEATRNGILIWDAVALKGDCHLWINGEDDPLRSEDDNVLMWEGIETPPPARLTNVSTVQFFTDCSDGETDMKAGETWRSQAGADGSIIWTKA